MQRKKVIETIKNFELIGTGLKNINTAYIKIKNLKERKDYFVADVIIGIAEENWEERYNKCKYPKKLIKSLMEGKNEKHNHNLKM